MALNNIGFVLGQGGIGRLPANEDGVSALIFAQSSPLTWNQNLRDFRSIRQIEAAGIEESDPIFAEAWYQSKEFFRQNPNTILWIGFQVTATEVNTIAQGKVRQIGVKTAYTLANVTVVNEICEELSTQKSPCIAILGIEETTDLSLLTPTPRNQTNELVSVVIAGDHQAQGAALADALGLEYIPAYGAVLGAVSRAKVSDRVAWVQNFDFAHN
jgi:hypothetical protein